MWCMSLLMSCWFVPQWMLPGMTPVMANSYWWPLWWWPLSWYSLSPWVCSCATEPNAARPPRGPCKKIQDLFALFLISNHLYTYIHFLWFSFFCKFCPCLISPWRFIHFPLIHHLASRLTSCRLILFNKMVISVIFHSVSYDRTKANAMCGWVYLQNLSEQEAMITLMCVGA